MAHEAKTLFPRKVRCYRSGVIQRNSLAPGLHGLREAQKLAFGKRRCIWIVLVIVLSGQTVLCAEVVVDIRVELLRPKIRLWTQDDRVSKFALQGLKIRRRAGDEEAPVRRLCLKQGQRLWGNLERRDGGTEIFVDCGCNARGVASVG